MFDSDVSPYCFDFDERTLLCVSTPDIAGATFLYQAQRHEARSVIKVPFDALPKARASPTLIFSIGRCGSTLLHRAFDAAGVRTVSEPDYFTQAAICARQDDALRNAIGGATELLPYAVIKLRAECNHAPLLIAGAFRAPNVIFVLRDPVDWAVSVRRLSPAMADPAGIAALRARWSSAWTPSRGTTMSGSVTTRTFEALPRAISMPSSPGCAATPASGRPRRPSSPARMRRKAASFRARRSRTCRRIPVSRGLPPRMGQGPAGSVDRATRSAATVMGTTQSMTPLTVPQAMQRAVAAIQRGDLREAEHLCRQVLAVNGSHFDALYLLGIIAGQAGRPQEAVELLARASTVNPQSADAYFNLGVALGELKRLPEALESYERALALRPDYADAHFNRGVVLADLNRPADALECY
jgi:tetratricopeptide (TPR) repeat protein